MPVLVSAGQITIVDNNDARPITAYLTVSPGPQQVFSKDSGLTAWTPDWTTANAGVGLIITAKVHVGVSGGTSEVSGQLTNRRFSFDLSTAITGSATAITGSSLDTRFEAGTYTVTHNSSKSEFIIKANMKETVTQVPIYFEGDYTDPVTGLISRVVAQITLSMVQTGTNAIYVITRGANAIEPSQGTTKNCIAISADLMRSTGVDTTNISYQWYVGINQIINSGPYNTQFGLKTVAAPAIPTGSPAEIGVNLPAAAGWSTHNTLVVHETGVTDMAIFRVVIKDLDSGTSYQGYFTVYDISDPYDLRLISSAGDKFQNGNGSTSIIPEVYYGVDKITDLTGWGFTWMLRNRNGIRAGFIDTTKTAVATGRTITSNTVNTFTYDNTAISFVAGDLIKVVKTDGVTASYYEVLSSSGNTVTIKTSAFTMTEIDFVSYPQPTANEYQNGKLFACTAQGTRSTSGAAAVVVTGYDIDAKGTIYVEAYKP